MNSKKQMKKKIIISILSILFGIFQSCSNDNYESSSAVQTPFSVYVSGSESDGTKLVAKIWKDGVPILLSHSNIGDESAASVYVLSLIHI